MIAAVLIAAETLLHVQAVKAVLPARTHFYHPMIARRIEAAERVVRLHDRIDVLFIGSSIVRSNLHPLIFDQLLGQAPRGIVSFNAGLSGLWPTSVHLYAEHVWLPMLRPRVVVQGVRYPELAATAHAKNETQVWSGLVEAGWRDADLPTRIRAEAVSRLNLLQYHGALTKALDRWRQGWVGELDPDLDESVDVRGYSPRGASAVSSPDEWTIDLPNDGTCERPRCDVGFAALRRTIAAARASGSTYVLLNVPEHSRRWRDPEAAARYSHYVASLRLFAESEGVAFVDPTEGNPFRFADTPYNDLSHMTAAGARQFTRDVATHMAPVLRPTLSADAR